MHLVAEIIFIFLIVYLTGSSSKHANTDRFFIAMCPAHAVTIHTERFEISLSDILVIEVL